MSLLTGCLVFVNSAQNGKKEKKAAQTPLAHRTEASGGGETMLNAHWLTRPACDFQWAWFLMTFWSEVTKITYNNKCQLGVVSTEFLIHTHFITFIIIS